MESMSDRVDAAVRKLLTAANKQGNVSCVTHDQMKALFSSLSSQEFTSEEMEEVLVRLGEMRINVVENDEADDGKDD